MRRVKILATVGPASREPAVVEALLSAGVDGFRVNFSHGVPDDHRGAVRTIREAAARMGREVAILGDLSGPKIRCRTFEGGPVMLEEGQPFTLTTRDVLGSIEGVGVTYPLWRDLRAGDPILLDDGLLRMRVVAIEGEDTRCVVEIGGKLSDRKGINLPGAKLSVPALTPKDHQDALLAKELGVDYLALSFVRHPNDLHEARRAVGPDVPLIAKIEKPEAVDLLEAIIEVSEGIMVARGDLGVELGPEKVPLVQKQAIMLANRHRKLVVTATQMLESMTSSPRPTRAEAADVANAVLDATDVVMLSGETASGKYPVLAVQMMDSIAREIEGSALYRELTEPPVTTAEWDFTNACAAAASLTSRHARMAALVVYTTAGHTANMVAEFRPRAPIVAVTARREIAQRMALQWGVIPVVHALPETPAEVIAYAVRIARETLAVADGETIGIVHGSQRESGTKSFVLYTLPAS